MTKVKIGIIGCGTVAGYGHLPTTANHPDCELYAIAEIDKKRLQEVGDLYAIPQERRFSEYQRLLALPEVEVVTVSTRVEQHKPVVLDAVKAKKNIFCEKPIAPTIEEGWEMVQAAKQSDVLLLINLHNRVKSSVKLILDYLRKNQIGKLHTIRTIHLWSGADNTPRADGRSRRDLLSEEGGGPIVDCGVHFFDLARLFAQSDYKQISAIGQWVEKKYSNPGHVIASCIFENGVMYINEQSWLYTNTAASKNVVHRVELLGTEGLISAFWDWDPKQQKCFGEKVQLFNAEGFTETVHDFGKPFAEMYHRLAKIIRTGIKDPDLAYGEDGIRAMEAALAALNSTKKKS
ncbi:MAG: Gfo/Idh/MocA family oxidoreductase [bacterium]|nr:Gfo/Idh/MocA family oxidoreductase [bacterium]